MVAEWRKSSALLAKCWNPRWDITVFRTQDFTVVPLFVTRIMLFPPALHLHGGETHLPQLPPPPSSPQLSSCYTRTISYLWHNQSSSTLHNNPPFGPSSIGTQRREIALEFPFAVSISFIHSPIALWFPSSFLSSLFSIFRFRVGQQPSSCIPIFHSNVNSIQEPCTIHYICYICSLAEEKLKDRQRERLWLVAVL